VFPTESLDTITFEVHPTVHNRRKELTDRFRCKSTMHIYAGTFRLSSVWYGKLNQNSFINHADDTVVKLGSNVTTDSRRVHFSKQMDCNTRTTCEVANIGTLNYLGNDGWSTADGS
jgi:hypothetical protein